MCLCVCDWSKVMTNSVTNDYAQNHWPAETLTSAAQPPPFDLPHALSPRACVFKWSVIIQQRFLERYQRVLSVYLGTVLVLAIMSKAEQ